MFLQLLEFLNAKLASNSCGEEGSLIIGILCLILRHSTNHVLKEASMAILTCKSLVSTVDAIIQRVCTKGPSIVDQEEAGPGECLIFILLLYFFSLKRLVLLHSVHSLKKIILTMVSLSLYLNFQENFDWQDLLQSSNDEVEQLPAICIKCSELCRLLHFGPPLIKLVTSQCLVEVFTGISDQRTRRREDLRCSRDYLESTIAVLEGLVFYGDSRVAMNCATCLSMMIRWEELRDSKWSRLIVEELIMTLAVPSLASKYLTNQHKPAAHIAAALVSMNNKPHWVASVFDISCISGILDNISVGNVSAEIVMLLRELVAKKYLNKEQVVRLHQLFQVRLSCT